MHSLKDDTDGWAVEGDALTVEPPGGLVACRQEVDGKLNKASFIMVLRFYITNSYYVASNLLRFYITNSYYGALQ